MIFPCLTSLGSLIKISVTFDASITSPTNWNIFPQNLYVFSSVIPALLMEKSWINLKTVRGAQRGAHRVALRKGVRLKKKVSFIH